MPRVSLITTFHDSEKYLEVALRSIREQTYSDWELILFDDGSTDRSPQIARDFAAGDSRVKLIQSSHVGRNAALCASHACATGDYVGWLDADDRLRPAALARTTEVLDADPSVGMVYTDHLEMNQDGHVLGLGRRSQIPFSKRRLLIDFVTFSFRLIRSDVFWAAGGVDSTFQAAIDYDLSLRISELSEVRRVHEALYVYRKHRRQMSVQKRALQIREASRAVRTALERQGLSQTFQLCVEPQRPRFRLERLAHARGAPSVLYTSSNPSSSGSLLYTALHEARVAHGHPVRPRLPVVLRELVMRREVQALHILGGASFVSAPTREQAVGKTWLLKRVLRFASARGLTVLWTPPTPFDAGSGFPEVDREFERLMFEQAARILVFSEASCAELSSRAPSARDHITVVPHGHYLGAHPLVARQIGRAELGLGTEEVLFLCFGNLGGRKDARSLAREFERLDPSLRGVLLYVGNPFDFETADSLRKIAERDSRIRTFFGDVPDEDVQLYFGAADVAVLPYTKPGTHRGLILAMSSGLPVVAPRETGGLILESGGENFLYDATNAESLGRALTRAAQHPGRREIGRANTRRIRALDWSRAVESVSSIFDSMRVVDERNPG